MRFWGEGATLVSLSSVGQPVLLGFVFVAGRDGSQLQLIRPGTPGSPVN